MEIHLVNIYVLHVGFTMVATAPFKGVAVHDVLLNHNHMDSITVR